MKIIDTPIEGLFVIEPTVHGDHRGYFMETWRKQWFSDIPGFHEFVQDNHSKSIKGTLRGLHYQIRQPQGKYIRTIKGKIFDAVVDLRKSSATYGKWYGEVLSDDNKRALLIPPGFAHGFYVMSEEAEIVYKCTDYYAADLERTLLWKDPAVGIEWPIQDDDLVISDKDINGQMFVDCEKYS